MKLLILLVCALVSVQAVILIEEDRCYNARILSRSATPDDPAFGNFNWQVGGDYSGTHGGPGSSGSLSGFHFTGRTSPFRLRLTNNLVIFDADLNTNYEAGSDGTSISFLTDGFLTLSVRPGSAGSALDLNKEVTLNEMGISGDLPFTLVRSSDGTSYSGTATFLDQLYSGTDFNGAGLTDSTLTIWLWGTETNGSGHGFMAGGTKPLAIDLVLSGSLVDCDTPIGALDCEDTGTCDPVDCRDTEAGCKIWAGGNCATLCLIDGTGSDCSPAGTPA